MGGLRTGCNRIQNVHNSHVRTGFFTPVISEQQQQHQKAIYRGLLRVALVWGVDLDNAKSNPVFWHNGALNYVSPMSHDEAVFDFLRNRGLMSEGHNHAHRLEFSFGELNDVADADFAKGLDFEEILGLLVMQLAYRFNYLNLSPHGESRWRNGNDERDNEVNALLRHISVLGYLEEMPQQSAASGYRWTKKAAPMLKTYLFCELGE